MMPSKTHKAGIQINKLSVRYPGNIQALDGIDLNIQPGLFGLLGPNGAGKTTLMKVLTTLLPPTSGMVQILGNELPLHAKSIRASLGYLPQDFQSYPQLKAWEALNYYAILNKQINARKRKQRVEAVLDQVNLQEYRNRRVGKFSGGMLRRLGIAQAILSDAPFLIFDEPTAGLDPKERVHFRNFIGELSRDRIVILSTHIVADIGSACNRLAVLNHGQIQFHGTQEELLNQAEGYVWKTTIQEMEYEEFSKKYIITSRLNDSQGIVVRFLHASKDNPMWEQTEPTLEDAYIWLTGGRHD
ncbi:ATP-binding cassette domain-containing protein [bacterium]|nr:ATP-binding cassette domain-containing protein [bacterium]